METQEGSGIARMDNAMLSRGLRQEGQQDCDKTDGPQISANADIPPEMQQVIKSDSQADHQKKPEQKPKNASLNDRHAKLPLSILPVLSEPITMLKNTMLKKTCW